MFLRHMYLTAKRTYDAIARHRISVGVHRGADHSRVQRPKACEPFSVRRRMYSIRISLHIVPTFRSEGGFWIYGKRVEVKSQRIAQRLRGKSPCLQGALTLVPYVLWLHIGGGQLSIPQGFGLQYIEGIKVFGSCTLLSADRCSSVNRHASLPEGNAWILSIDSQELLRCSGRFLYKGKLCGILYSIFDATT